MDSVTKNGVTTTYTYDSNGLRTSKTTGDDVTEYTYLGSSLVYQVTNKGQSDEVSLYFYYDEAGIAAFSYKSAEHPTDNGLYYYIRNPQGDILGIVDRTGTLIARYDYSAYGEYKLVWAPEEVPSEQIQRNNRVRNANPFDYRGYYYDTETGLYYVSSRYYDPEIGRFLNSDETSYIYADGINYGVNLFAYCENNPVNMYDPNGTIALLTCVIIGAIAGAAIGAIASKMIYGKVNGWWVLGGAIVGGVLGYFGGAFFGASGIKAGTLASKISMSKVRWLGKIGEKMAKWPKNTTRIKSFTGSAKYRIPDYLNKANKVIGDVKNVKKLSYTKQLQDFMLYAEKYGYTYIIKVRQSTQFSSTIKNLIDAGKIIIMYIK